MAGFFYAIFNNILVIVVKPQAIKKAAFLNEITAFMMLVFRFLEAIN